MLGAVPPSDADPLFKETYWALSAALDLDRFSIGDLAQRAGIRRKTAESWVYRNEGRILRRVGQATRSRKGRRPTLWEVTPEARQQAGVEVERVSALLADSAIRARQISAPNLDNLPDLDTAKRLIAKAIALHAGAYEPESRAPAQSNRSPTVDDFIGQARNWLMSVTSTVQEWGLLGHHPTDSVHARISSAVATVSDPATFKLRVDLERQFGLGGECHVVKLADWIATVARGEASKQDAIIGIRDFPNYDIIIDEGYLRLKWALWDRLEDETTGDGVRLAILLAIARPAACATFVDKVGTVAAAIVRKVIFELGTERIYKSIATSLSDYPRGTQGIYAHVLAAVGQHPSLSTDPFLARAADVVRDSPAWKDTFLPLLARIKWSEPTLDRKRFLGGASPQHLTELLVGLTEANADQEPELHPEIISASFDLWLIAVGKIASATPPHPDRSAHAEPDPWNLEGKSAELLTSVLATCSAVAESAESKSPHSTTQWLS